MLFDDDRLAILCLGETARGAGRNFTLEELFLDSELWSVQLYERKMRLARYKIVEAFVRALDNRWRPTDNYIVCNHQLANLRDEIVRTTDYGRWRWLVSLTDLPMAYRYLPQYEVNAVLARVGAMLLESELDRLFREGAIWYINNAWQACQSLVDQRDGLRREVYGRSLVRRATVKDDRRTYHGRPARDRARLNELGIAPGVSVGLGR